MLQFAQQRDVTLAGFVFEGLRPNGRPNDLCGEGLCRKRLQQSIDRGMFFVFADKVGTCRTESGERHTFSNPPWRARRLPKFHWGVEGCR